MSEDTLFWLVVVVTTAAAFAASAVVGFVREHWSPLVAVLVLSTLVFAAGTGISFAYGGYLDVVFLPAIAAGYFGGRILRRNAAPRRSAF